MRDLKSDQNRTSFENLLDIFHHIGTRRRIQLGLLFLLMILNGISEAVSLGAIIPFLAILDDPDSLMSQGLIKSIGMYFGLVTADQYLIAAAILFTVAICLSVCIRLSNVWLNGQLAAAVGTDLSCKSFRNLLFQPYASHINTNSSIVITSMTTNLARTVSAIICFLQLFTALVVALALLVGLLAINAKIAISSIVIFGLIYVAVACFSRNKLIDNSSLIREAASRQLKTLQEGLGAIRDIILDNSQEVYINDYRFFDRQFRKPDANNQFLSVFPRQILEALVVTAMILCATFYAINNRHGNSIVPLLGALALGAQRLLPALQQIYVSWSSLKGFNADISAILSILELPSPKFIQAAPPLRIKECVRFESVSFQYIPSGPSVLKNVSVNISKGERVALIGETGGGKSTFADLLMGLLTPTKGNIYIDNSSLCDPDKPEVLLSWRASIAHVPQEIYLSDSTVAENIAFGVRKDEIDLNRVMQAAQQARIDGFIESRPGGYFSLVGERGVQLSGGQRQRIGIARALYKNSSFLVLDEITSSLDSNTEDLVMDSIDKLSRDITVFIIAHRLSTTRRCDRILQIKDGSIVA